MNEIPDSLLKHEPIHRAYGDLLRAAQRKVRIEHDPGAEAAMLGYTRAEFVVRVNTESPLARHSTVHELCHAIMFEEGYPLAVYPAPEWFPSDLAHEMSVFVTNDWHHCEVFRRMHEYGLDMAPYYRRWDGIAADHFSRLTATRPSNDFRHLHAWLIFPWFYMDWVGEKHLDKYAAFDPVIHDLARQVYIDSGEQDGFSTPDKAHHTYERMISRVMRFCAAPDHQSEAGISLTVGIRLFRLDDYLDHLAATASKTER